MSSRTARANWAPIDWGAFCKQALTDANRQYRRQLLSQATSEDLSAMYRELMQKRNAGDETVEDQLCDIDREFALRTAT